MAVLSFQVLSTLPLHSNSKRSFLLLLMENPNLLEHAIFTDLLWATFHLTKELGFRQTMDLLSRTDLDHLQGDMDRTFHHLANQWLMYMEHLQSDYPYLYSLAVRTNPFVPGSKVEVI